MQNDRNICVDTSHHRNSNVKLSSRDDTSSNFSSVEDTSFNPDSICGRQLTTLIFWPLLTFLRCCGFPVPLLCNHLPLQDVSDCAKNFHCTTGTHVMHKSRESLQTSGDYVFEGSHLQRDKHLKSRSRKVGDSFTSCDPAAGVQHEHFDAFAKSSVKGRQDNGDHTVQIYTAKQQRDVVCKSCHRKIRASKLAFVIFESLSIFNVLRYCTVFYEATSFDDHTAISVGYILLQISFICQILATYSSLSKHLHSLLQSVDRYEFRFRTCVDCRGVNRKVKHIIRAVCVCQVVFAVMIGVSAVTFMPSLLRNAAPFDKWGGWPFYSVWTVVCLTFLWQGLVFSALALFTHVIFYAVRRELSDIRKQFKRTFVSCEEADEVGSTTSRKFPDESSGSLGTISDDGGLQSSRLRSSSHVTVGDLAEKFNHLRSRHVYVVGILEQSQRCLNHLIGIGYIFGIPFICIIIYGLAGNSLALDEVAFLFGFITYASLVIVVNTLIGAIITEEVC